MLQAQWSEKKIHDYFLNYKHIFNCITESRGNSLAVQWLGVWFPLQRAWVLFPSQGTNILKAVRPGQKKKKNPPENLKHTLGSTENTNSLFKM